MLYQAAVILTYPVRLERALTPCGLRALTRRRPRWPRRYQSWGAGGDFGGPRRGGGTRPDASAAWRRWNLSGWVHPISGLGRAARRRHGMLLGQFRVVDTCERTHACARSVPTPTPGAAPETSPGKLVEGGKSAEGSHSISRTAEKFCRRTCASGCRSLRAPGV